MKRTHLLTIPVLVVCHACTPQDSTGVDNEVAAPQFAQQLTDQWGPAVPVTGSVLLNTPALEGCPSESPDGRSLYFASNRAGDIDIYVSHRQPKGEWGDPDPLLALGRTNCDYRHDNKSGGTMNVKPVISLLLLLAACGGPARQVEPNAPVPASEVRYRRQIFQNHRLTAFLLALPPQHATVMHRHDTDILSVFVNGGRTVGTFQGRGSVPDTFAVGDVRFRPAGFTHATHNVGADAFLSVIIEFSESHGTAQPVATGMSVSCAPATETTCVREKAVLCTATFCAYDVTMDPGAVRPLASARDHLLVALADYRLTHETDKVGVVSTRATGELEYLMAGAPHRSINSGQRSVRFIDVSIEKR